MLNIRCKRIFLTVISLVLCFAASSVRAQQTPKKERFGKSLERIKWDEQRKTTIEKKPENQPNTAAAEITLRVETVLAVFEVLVVDKQGQLVKGLGKDDFEIAEDGIPQQASTFALGDGGSVPRSIVLVVDYSSSQVPYLDRCLFAAQKLIEQLKPNDRMAIVTDDVALLVPFTTDKNKLKSGLTWIQSRFFTQGLAGRSTQYSALMAVLRELLQEEEQPIVIFQTDGDQYRSLRPAAPDLLPGEKKYLVEFGLEDLHKSADLARATIYSIYPGLRLIGFDSAEQLRRTEIIVEHEQQAFRRRSQARFGLGRGGSSEKPSPDHLKRFLVTCLSRQLHMSWLSEQTGGWLEYLETPDQAEAIYARILNAINHRYLLGYYPTNTARDGRWRTVQIKVRAQPDYVVMGRDRYLVPAAEK